jgi:hypothetical protein
LDWRRYVNVSSSVVSLLIALISVMALSVQHIKGVFDKGHSNVRVAVVRTSPGMISLLAFNDGNRPGAVSPAEFDVYDSRVGNVQYMMVPKDGAFIVEPGKEKQIDLVFQEKNVEENHRDWIKEGTVRNNMEPDANFETDCRIRIELIQHGKFLQFFDKEAERRWPVGVKLAEVPEPMWGSPEPEHVELRVYCHPVFPWRFKWDTTSN